MNLQNGHREPVYQYGLPYGLYDMGVEPKIGGTPPKWMVNDGENSGKPY